MDYAQALPETGTLSYLLLSIKMAGKHQFATHVSEYVNRVKVSLFKLIKLLPNLNL
jgi:hypothetical protein